MLIYGHPKKVKALKRSSSRCADKREVPFGERHWKQLMNSPWSFLLKLLCSE